MEDELQPHGVTVSDELADGGFARAADGLTERVADAIAGAARMLAAPVRAPLAHGARLLAPVRADVRRGVLRSLGFPADPPARSERAEHSGEAFIPPGGMARRVHADLPSMIVGGLAALLLQTLHPLAMAGVADHSLYEEDPIGRLRRTAAFVGATTFGTVEDAHRAIEQVRAVHHRVRGRAPDGRRYSASDPELLTWVHVAEVSSFLLASERYGPERFSAAERDLYFAETAVVARELGARWVPERAEEAEAYFLRVRPELYAGPQALAARDFLLRGVARRPNDRVVYAGVAAAAVSVLPGWARTELRIPSPPFADAVLVRPAARALCGALRWTLRR